MRVACEILSGSAIATAFMLCAPAHAQTTVTADQVVTRACRGFEGRPLTQERLADIILNELRHSGSDPWIQAHGDSLSFLRWIEEEPRNLPRDRAEAVADLRGLVWDIRRELLRNQDTNAAYVQNPERFNSENPRLFTEGTWLSPLCRGEQSNNENSGGASPLEIRNSPNDLGLSGAALIAASPASFGLTRTVTSLDDGTSKTVRDFSISGTLGYRFLNEGGDSGYVYASYTLNRSRTRPIPTLAPGANEGDGDTNTVELGGRAIIYTLPATSVGLALSANGSVLHDFTHGSDLLRLRLNSSLAVSAVAWEPVPAPCGLGFYRAFVGGLRGICQLQAQFEVAEVLERGTGAFKDTDNYGAVGGRFSYGLFLPQDSTTVSRLQSGAFAEASVRYLTALFGNVDDIERYDLAIGYRFMTGSGVGLDVTASYQYGTNDKSFEDDDIFKVGLGIIF